MSVDLDAIRERAEAAENAWWRADVLALVGRIQELEDANADWERMFRQKDLDLSLVSSALKEVSYQLVKAEAERDTLREAGGWLWDEVNAHGLSPHMGSEECRAGEVMSNWKALTQGAGDESAPHPDWRNGAGIVDDT